MVKNYGANVSGWLDPEGRNWETGVYQASKPVLDKELNLLQDNQQYLGRLKSGVPSGWFASDVLDSSDSTAAIFAVSAVANRYSFPALTAIVNDWPILVRYTNSATTSNSVDLGAAPAGVASKRTDLVFLEVWRSLISAASSTVGKSASGRIWRNGNVKVAPADDLTLNLADDILDGVVGSETTKRVQIQYRVRVHQNVNVATYPQGLSDPSVVARTVPASAAAPDGTATAFTYANQSANGDPGLWVAGDGNPANGLGTVDGYMYAIPLSAVFRRNTTAFNRDNNHNGGAATPGPSGRPDGLFYDIVAARDVLDLRNGVSPSGWDIQELLQKNVNYLFDNANLTIPETTTLGGGSVGHTNIWADEIGSVDNPGANLIRNFDAVSRRFSDRPILETVWVKYTPANQNIPGATWVNGRTISIDPTALPIYPYSNVNVVAGAPSNISIVSIVGALLVGVSGGTTESVSLLAGDFDDAAGPSGLTVTTLMSIGSCGLYFSEAATVPVTPIIATIRSNLTAKDSTLYLKLLVSYPKGQGLTKTPTADYAAASFVNELPGNLPASAPYNYQSMETQAFDYPHREVDLTYHTTSIIWISYLLQVPGVLNTKVLVVPDRVASVSQIKNLTNAGIYTGPVTISDDGYMVFIVNIAGNWSNAIAPGDTVDRMEVTYQAVRPIPRNNCQFTLWYEARAPQTIQSALLGTSLQVTPRYICPNMYCLVSGSGSLDESYPFPYQYVQSPGVYPGSGGTFSGDHELDGSGEIWLADFNAGTGFLQVPTLIPAVPTPQNLVFQRGLGDVDAENRSFFKAVPAGYIPSSWGQPLSDPKKHKNCLPAICELTADGPIGPKGTLVLVMFSRWAEFDSANKIAFDSNLASNYTTASVYRIKGNPLANRK